MSTPRGAIRNLRGDIVEIFQKHRYFSLLASVVKSAFDTSPEGPLIWPLAPPPKPCLSWHPFPSHKKDATISMSDVDQLTAPSLKTPPDPAANALPPQCHNNVVVNISLRFLSIPISFLDPKTPPQTPTSLAIQAINPRLIPPRIWMFIPPMHHPLHQPQPHLLPQPAQSPRKNLPLPQQHIPPTQEQLNIIR